MKNNSTPIVIAILAVGVIITLAIVLTRNSGSETEPATISETEQQPGEEQVSEPQPAPIPIPQPTPAPTPVPNPQPGGLSVWDSLSVQEKTDLNPFDCDHETQWVSAEDGTCIYKQIDCPEGQTPLPDGGCQNINDIECEDWQETNSNGECINKPGANDIECEDWHIVDADGRCVYDYIELHVNASTAPGYCFVGDLVPSQDIIDRTEPCTRRLVEIALKHPPETSGVLQGIAEDILTRDYPDGQRERTSLVIYRHNGSDNRGDYEMQEAIFAWPPPIGG